MARISTFIVSLVLASLCIVIIATFMGNLSTNYSVSYDNTTFDSYNKLNELSATTGQIQNQTLSIKEKSGILDVIGGYFSDGYQALRLTAQSFSTFESMTNAGLSQLGLGKTGEYIRIALITIVLVIIIIGVLISAIVKANL